MKGAPSRGKRGGRRAQNNVTSAAGRGRKRSHRGNSSGKNRGKTGGALTGDIHADAERVSKAASNFLASSKATDGTIDSDNPDDDHDMCLICCEPLVYAAIGPCNHALVCSTCVLRQRILYKDRSCSLCKATTDRVVITSDKSRMTWQSWNDFIFGDQCGGRLVAYDECDAFFDTHDEEHILSIKRLIGYSCGICNDAAGACESIAKLRAHLMGAHKRMLCGVCVDAGRKFVSEMPRFTKSQLERHCAKGDPAEGLRKHPQCNFCRPKRFFDDEALYHHMVEKHFQCDVCQAMGNGNRFFKDYQMLDRHFSHKHYKCEQPECLLKRFVVFRSEIDLQGHMAAQHPYVRYNRKIAVNFTVGRGMGSGQGNPEEDTAEMMSFSDDFMQQFRRGGQGNNSVVQSRGRQAPPVEVIEDAFPTLHDSAATASKTSSDAPTSKAKQANPNWAGGIGAATGQRIRRGKISIRSESDFPGLGSHSGDVASGVGRHSMSNLLKQQARHRGIAQGPPSANNERDFPAMPKGPPGGRLGIFRETSEQRRRSKQVADALRKKNKPTRSVEGLPEGAKILSKQSTGMSLSVNVAPSSSKDNPNTNISTHSSAATWACSRCTLINKGSSYCTACGAAAIYGMRVLKSKKSGPKIGPTPSELGSSTQEAKMKQETSFAQKEDKATLARRIRGILGDKKFPTFQRLCGAYAKQNISAHEYYTSVSRLCSHEELASFWEGLLSMLPSSSLQQPLERLFQRDASRRSKREEGSRKLLAPRAPTSYIPSAVFQPPKATPSLGKKMGKKKKKNPNIMPGFEPSVSSGGMSKNYEISSASSVQSEIDKWVASNVSGNSQQSEHDEYPSLPKKTPPASVTRTNRALLIKHSKNKHKDDVQRVVAAIPDSAKIITKKREGIKIDTRMSNNKASTSTTKAVEQDGLKARVIKKNQEKLKIGNKVKNSEIKESKSSASSSDQQSNDYGSAIRVKIHNLVTDVELNGLIGVQGEWNEEKKRYRVTFGEGTGHGPRWLKPGNIEVVSIADDKESSGQGAKKKKKKKKEKMRMNESNAASVTHADSSGSIWASASFSSTGSSGSNTSKSKNSKKKRVKMDRQKKKKKTQQGVVPGFSISAKGARGKRY